MTNKWCDKLKADYGANLRLYVVERGVPSDADMSYIEQCATNTGEKVKKASNAAGLKTALDEIAADLKTFGAYQEARVVE